MSSPGQRVLKYTLAQLHYIEEADPGVLRPSTLPHWWRKKSARESLKNLLAAWYFWCVLRQPTCLLSITANSSTCKHICERYKEPSIDKEGCLELMTKKLPFSPGKWQPKKLCPPALTGRVVLKTTLQIIFTFISKPRWRLVWGVQILLKEGRLSFLKKLELVILVSREEERIYPSFFSTKSADEDELYSSPMPQFDDKTLDASLLTMFPDLIISRGSSGSSCFTEQYTKMRATTMIIHNASYLFPVKKSRFLLHHCTCSLHYSHRCNFPLPSLFFRTRLNRQPCWKCSWREQRGD